MSLPPVLSISPPACLVKACVRANTRGAVGRVIKKYETHRMGSRRHPQERSGQLCGDQHVLQITGSQEPFEIMVELTNTAYNHGILGVAATGDDDVSYTCRTPGKIPNFFTAAASDEADNRAF